MAGRPKLNRRAITLKRKPNCIRANGRGRGVGWGSRQRLPSTHPVITMKAQHNRIRAGQFDRPHLLAMPAAPPVLGSAIVFKEKPNRLRANVGGGRRGTRLAATCTTPQLR